MGPLVESQNGKRRFKTGYKHGLLHYLFLAWKFMKTSVEASTASMEAFIASMKASTKVMEASTEAVEASMEAFTVHRLHGCFHSFRESHGSFHRFC